MIIWSIFTLFQTLPAGSPYHPPTEDLKKELSEVRRKSQPLIKESPAGMNLLFFFTGK
jgi:hypothetical protein